MNDGIIYWDRGTQEEHRVLEQVKSSALSLRYHIDIPLRLPDGNTKLANEHPILELSEGASASAVRFPNSWMDKNKTAMMWSAKQQEVQDYKCVAWNQRKDSLVLVHLVFFPRREIAI